MLLEVLPNRLHHGHARTARAQHGDDRGDDGERQGDPNAGPRTSERMNPHDKTFVATSGIGDGSSQTVRIGFFAVDASAGARVLDPRHGAHDESRGRRNVSNTAALPRFR
jgi:hypothetical protein